MTKSDRNDTETTLGFSDGVLAGILLSIVAAVVISITADSIMHQSIKTESLELMEARDVEVMMSERTSGSIRFATDEGYVIYYDGKLYVERDTHD